MRIISTGKKGRSREGKTIKGIVNGKKISFKLHKSKPNKCSTPRRICIKCLKNVIRKNDSNYESKICKDCS